MEFFNPVDSLSGVAVLLIPEAVDSIGGEGDGLGFLSFGSLL